MNNTARARRAIGSVIAAGAVPMGSIGVAGAVPSEKHEVTVTDLFNPRAFDVTLDGGSLAGASLDPDSYKFALDNQSVGPHVLIVYKIPDGFTEADLLEALNSDQPPPEGAFEVGAVFAKPGQQHQKQYDLSLEGTYGFFCPIPTPDGSNVHFNMGFVGVFEVE